MLLKKGSTGEDVKKLQTRLGITPDGSFGPGTEVKVKEWQTLNGLTADGIVGDGTWGKLFSGTETKAPATPNVESIPTIPTSNFKLDKLKGHVPDSVIAQIPETAAKFNITNTLRLAHFLAQCGHESGGFKAVSENLNYSAKGLRGTFGKYFPTDALAASYERKPEKIANRVYSSRMGNGDEASGEGWKYRGRGYIQLTGKSNYTKFDGTVGDDITGNPDLVATKYPLASAAFFFNSNSLWAICDRGADDATVTAVTKRVNGGTIGLADRIKHFKEYYSLLV
jgi:putative chitinase